MKNDIDVYLESFPRDVRDKLIGLRELILSIVPLAEERMSYGMPTYRLKRNLVHFAAYKNHIGFYPAPSAIVHFANELKEYKTSKGAIQFPANQDLPYDLITKIVKFRIAEELNRSK